MIKNNTETVIENNKVTLLINDILMYRLTYFLKFGRRGNTLQNGGAQMALR